MPFGKNPPKKLRFSLILKIKPARAVVDGVLDVQHSAKIKMDP